MSLSPDSHWLRGKYATTLLLRGRLRARRARSAKDAAHGCSHEEATHALLVLPRRLGRSLHRRVQAAAGCVAEMRHRATIREEARRPKSFAGLFAR
jgi:hypothetical protein